MTTQNYKIQPFEIKNIPFILDVVLPMWSPPMENMTFRRLYVENIVRNNCFENEYRFQLVDTTNNEFCSMAFFARKTDICKADDWFKLEAKKIPQNLQRSMQNGKLYIELMDEKTRAFMKNNDIQLTLYVSRRKGCGSKLLNKLCKRLRDQGWKNLYLWTDCECDWQWYTDHGYELISKDVYEPFTEQDGEDYLTYIFKKAL